MSIPGWMVVIACVLRGRDVYRYGPDVPRAAWSDYKRNLWAARFQLLHVWRNALSIHPPVSLTNHMGFEDSATSQGASDPWQISGFWTVPTGEIQWPLPREPDDAKNQHIMVYGHPSSLCEEFYVQVRSFWWRFSGWCRRFR